MSAGSLTTGETLVIGGPRDIGAATTQTRAYAGAPVFRCLIVGLIALASFGEASAEAGRSVLLPISAPIPAPRPQSDDRSSVDQGHDQKQDRLRQTSQTLIGTTPQPIPPARQNVRVVGWAFLPDPSEEIELVGEAHARAVDAAEAGANVAAKLERATETVAALSLEHANRWE
ncbi:MAG: hypothetical protein ABW318_23560 [Vicinamibacterales bacterium]